MNGSGNELYLLILLTAVPYLFLMTRIARGLTKTYGTSSGAAGTTMITVVVATNRSSDVIMPLLHDLAVQDYDHHLFEVIVADDTGGAAGFMLPENVENLRIRVVPNNGHGKKSAVRCAIEAATGELIVATDDDCHVRPGWLSTIAAFYSREKPDMIICPVMLEDNGTMAGRMQQLEFLSLQGVTAGTATLGDPLMCNGAGMAFRRELYPTAGKDMAEDIPSGDDMFLLHYLKKKGCRIAWLEADEATVYTLPVTDLPAFIRQRARWASKAGSYSDVPSVITGASVALMSFTIIASATASLFNSTMLYITAALFIIKSVPDIMILYNRARATGKMRLMRYFPLVQLLYPVYVTVSVTTGLFRKKRW